VLGDRSLICWRFTCPREIKSGLRYNGIKICVPYLLISNPPLFQQEIEMVSLIFLITIFHTWLACMFSEWNIARCLSFERFKRKNP